MVTMLIAKAAMLGLGPLVARERFRADRAHATCGMEVFRMFYT